MNKSLKLILLTVLVVSAGFAAYKFTDIKKIGTSTENLSNKESQAKKSDDKTTESNISESVAEQTNEAQASAKQAEINDNAKSEVSQTSDSKTDAKAEEKAEPLPSDELNSKSVKDSKKEGKAVVTFRDGTTVTDVEINKELNDVPEQLSARMSLNEIKSFLAWREAYKKVITEAAIRSGVLKSDEVRKVIDKRKKTAAGFMLLDEKSKELMTFDALKQNYDKVWDKNFKGTKEFSLVALTTGDKGVADNIKNTAKDEAALKKILDANAAKVKQMDMDSRPQAMFPPEISDAVLKQGANTVVGPFEIKGSYMLFYVKSIKDAQKKEFTKEFAEEYKKAAARDFIKEYTQKLYKKYEIKIMDVNGKVVDPFNVINEKGSEKDQEDNLVKLSKLQDDATLATYNGGKITVKDLKEFYKVDNLLDQTFVSMAQQFNITLDKVVVYAIKLVMDDVVLSKEVETTGYDKQQKVIDKLIEIGNMEAQHAYYKEQVKVKSEDVKRTFDKFIKSIPEEDKNDNEISVKLAFFETKEDAAQTLQSLNSGNEKFSTVYKDKSAKKEAVDLGYVRKRGTSPELWSLLKTGASGACCKQIVELKSEQFGIKNRNFVLVYIADRRPVTLPSLSNEAEKKYFQRLAEREKAIELAKSQLMAGVKSIDGKSIEDINKSNPDYVNRMISVLLGYAG